MRTNLSCRALRGSEAIVLSSFLLLTPGGLAAAGNSPFANLALSYDPGSNASPGYTTPDAAVGSPQRFTSKGSPFATVVSPFSAAWGETEIVSVGAGGHLELRFALPVLDDPANPWGIDLIVFGNTGFSDAAWPDGVVAGLYGADGGTVSVSFDGANWVEVPGITADGLFPTDGYTDAGAYDETPGAVPTDFTQPMNPLLTYDDFDGQNLAGVRALYRGAGGGTGIDLASTGLSAISYVRIQVADGALFAPEIDAVADVAPQLPGDANLDGFVDVLDLLEVLAWWGPNVAAGPPADFDGSGAVDVGDVLAVLAGWTDAP